MPVQQKQGLIRNNAGKHQTQFGVYLVLNLPSKYLFLVPASQLMVLNLAAYASLQQECISVVAGWTIACFCTEYKTQLNPKRRFILSLDESFLIRLSHNL